MSDSDSPILSFCLTGRNDDYSESYVKRLSLCLNYLAHSAIEIGRLGEIEVVITDWNSEVPLSDAIHLTPQAASICRMIRVLPEVAVPLNFPGTAFHSARATNVAYRRARGQFHACMPADILISSVALAGLLDILSGRRRVTFDPMRTFMLASRRFLPGNLPDDQMTLTELDRFLQNAHATLAPDRPMYSVASAYGALIQHRTVTADIGGINESMGGWGFSDIEVGLRAAKNHSFAELSYFGVIFYDFHAAASTVTAKGKRVNAWESFDYDYKQPNWGLVEHELSVYQPSSNPSEIPPPAAQPRAFGEILSKSDVQHEVRAFAHPKTRRVMPHHILLFQLARVNRLRQYLEFGSNDDAPGLLVARVVPWAEFYYLLPPHPAAPGRNSVDCVMLAWNLFDAPLNNIFRPVPGDHADAVQRLVASFVGKPSFDLVSLHVDRPDYAVQCLAPVIPHLSTHGTVVVSASDSESLINFIQSIEEKTVLRVAFLSKAHRCVVLILPSNMVLLPNREAWPEADAKLHPIRRWPGQHAAVVSLRRLTVKLEKSLHATWLGWLRGVWGM